MLTIPISLHLMSHHYSRYSLFATTFEEFSSLKLNLDKCQACWIGSAKSKLDTPIDCNWVNIEKDIILTLGIFNSYDQSLADKGAVIIYDWDGGGRDMEGVWKKVQYPQRGFEKVFDSREGF